jgi:uncharacterized protein YkwD
MAMRQPTLLNWPGLLLAAMWLGSGGVWGQDDLSPLEAQIVREINLARSNPAAYAAVIAALRPYYDGPMLKKPGQPPLATHEGVAAVDEAIRFLQSAAPLPPLRLSPGLSRAANDHVGDLGPQGQLGHRGSDGSTVAERVKRYGSWENLIGENIAFGSDDARDIVRQFIIDDGMPERGHRDHLFNPRFRVVGVACGPHAAYRLMCVIALAGGYAQQRQK